MRCSRVIPDYGIGVTQELVHPPSHITRGKARRESEREGEREIEGERWRKGEREGERAEGEITKINIIKN